MTNAAIVITSAVAGRAAGISFHAARRIAVTELPAPLLVAGARAELGAVEGGEETSPAGLARDRGQRVLRRRRTGRRILRRITDTGAGAAVRVADQHAAGPVDGDVVEVEQVPARIAAAPVPVAQVDRVVRAGRHGRVTPRADAPGVGHRPNRPREPVVG